MTPAIILSIIGLTLTYGTALLTTWVKINIKIKEIEMRIQTLETTQSKTSNDLQKVVKELTDYIDKWTSSNMAEHKEISKKVDDIKDTITEIKVSVAKIK